MGALGLRALLGPDSDALGPPMDEIDADSRAQLERELEAAERGEGRR